MLFRLERIDSELSFAAQLIRMAMEDLAGTRGHVIDTQDRVTVVASVVGALLLVSGSDGPMVAEWLIAMKPDGDIEEADELGTEIVELLHLRHGEPEGEA